MGISTTRKHLADARGCAAARARVRGPASNRSGDVPMRRSLSLLALAIPVAFLAGCDNNSTFVDNRLGCDRVHSFSLGNNANGTLDPNDCQLTDGSAAEFYRFSIGSSRTVYANVTSNTVDPYIEIMDRDGNVVAEEDNGDTGYSELTTFLPSGTYYVVVTSFRPGEYGDYYLQTDYQ
jgi:hypothetical protein